MRSVVQADNHSDLHPKFRESALRFAQLLAEEGIHVHPFRDASLPVYSRLDGAGKSQANQDIELALSVFEETRAEGFRLTDSPKLIWRALRRFGWAPQGDIFDKIGDEDIIQVYSADQKAIFQNLNFFKWVSFTLEDLYTGTWFQLTRRDPAALQKLYQYALETLSGERTATFEPEVPEHLCEEVGTEALCRFWIRVAYVSPLRSEGSVAGFIAVNRCRPA